MTLARYAFAVLAFLTNAYLMGCTVDNFNILFSGKNIPDYRKLMAFGVLLCLLTDPERMLKGINFTAVALMFATGFIARRAQKERKRRKP